MKMFSTSALCPKCGNRLYTSDIHGYSFVCKECDENFYTVEVKECGSDYWEVNIPLAISDFENKRSQMNELAEKYDCDFLGYDDIVGLMDIGWKKGFPDSETLNSFVKDLEEQLKIIN